MLFLPALNRGVSVSVALRSRSLAVPRTLLLLVAIALLAAVPHALNMWSYPAFTIADDEGIYVSQAISWLHTGALAPYTYSYDHAPGGWIQIAVFYALTGGPATFGMPIDGARVLMLLLHVGSALLLFRIARRLGASMLAAGIVVAFFSVSPLAIFYQRMVLLDNIMVFWLLVSLALALDARSRAWIAASGIAFGIAVLSKETAVLLAPFLLVLAWQTSGWRGVLMWSGAATLAVLPYPLYALSRGELLPVADPYLPYVMPNDASARPSLISTLLWQLSRPGGGTFSFTNDFFYYLRSDWLWRDVVLLPLGLGTIIVNVYRGLRQRPSLVAAIAGLIPCLYLARGGIIFVYYIVFALPFLALNLGLALDAVLRQLEPVRARLLGASLLVLLVGIYWGRGTLAPLYTQHPDAPGREAAAWIKTYVPASATIVGRDDLLAYLREPLDGPAYPGFQVHWQVANDRNVPWSFGYDWSQIDYLVVDPHELSDFEETANTFALAALGHAHKVAEWTFVNHAAGPLHWDQSIQIWEADRLSDPNLAAFFAWNLHGRDQLCKAHVASCDDIAADSPHPYAEATARPQALTEQ